MTAEPAWTKPGPCENGAMPENANGGNGHSRLDRMERLMDLLIQDNATFHERDLKFEERQALKNAKGSLKNAKRSLKNAKGSLKNAKRRFRRPMSNSNTSTGNCSKRKCC